MSDRYEYKKINLSLEPKPDVESASNRWAAMGWRTVAVMPVSYADSKAGFAPSILVERKKENDGE
jgi:hypothetical protein